jgi:poly-gamma-glutamate synthesis protein (capsule biosynthesis protein)
MAIPISKNGPVDLPSGEISLEAFVNGKRIWQSHPLPMVSMEIAKLDGENEYILSLERHYSNMDREKGLRPYVYSVARNGLIARWRGSALAWPLLDAVLIPGNEGILCAIHRKDSFINPDPLNNETRSAVYRWNGFGFSGVDNAINCKECQTLLK